MRRITFLLILILILFTNFSFPQASSDLSKKEALMPIPSWVKEGVCLVYKVEVGGRVGIGSESSAASLFGYSIYIVTSIQENRVYGLIYTLLSSLRGEWTLDSKFQLLNTVGSGFYLHPKVLEETLRDRALYAQYGITVEGGPIGGNLYYLAITTRTQDEITTTMDQFTAEGIIQKSTLTRKNPKGGEAGNKVLVGLFKVSLPQGLKLPEISKGNVSYLLSYVIMGIISPLGTVSYKFIGAENKITNYEAISNLNYGTFTSKVLGDTYFGPFYINPSLLKMNPIISIPQIGFSINTAGYGQRGGILVTLSLSGQPIGQFEYDPNTGLLLSFSYYSTSNIIYGEIQR